MKRLLSGIRCVAIVALMMLVTSCASTRYVAARCDKEKKNAVIPVYNATRLDLVFLHETWKAWPGSDYVLPPWLDSSLNIVCGMIDIPISLVFDTLTLPFQGIDYCVRKDQIRQAKDLSRYTSRDLRKLTTNEVALLQAEVRDKTKVELGEKWGWCPLAPWLMAHFHTDNTSWVLVEVYPGYDIPEMSGMKLHFFDSSWRHVSSHAFPTGYRIFLDEVSVQTGKQIDSPLIVVKTTCAGPFITSPAPKRPAFEQGDFQLQYYTLIETNLCLVRLEDKKGIIARNHYRWRAPPKGPPVPPKTKEEWIACLDSTNVVHQLSALVWLTGDHLSSQEERMADHNQESASDSRLFESVCSDPRTASLMAELIKNKNHWVRDYARLGILKKTINERQPDRNVGSGISILVYDLDDGSMMQIGSADGKTLLYLDHVFPDGKRNRILPKEGK